MEQILVEDKETSAFEDVIRHGFERVRPKLRRALERNFDKFELYMQRNILRVPAHVDPKGTAAHPWYSPPAIPSCKAMPFPKPTV